LSAPDFIEVLILVRRAGFARARPAAQIVVREVEAFDREIAAASCRWEQAARGGFGRGKRPARISTCRDPRQFRALFRARPRLRERFPGLAARGNDRRGFRPLLHRSKRSCLPALRACGGSRPHNAALSPCSVRVTRKICNPRSGTTRSSRASAGFPHRNAISSANPPPRSEFLKQPGLRSSRKARRDRDLRCRGAVTGICWRFQQLSAAAPGERASRPMSRSMRDLSSLVSPWRNRQRGSFRASLDADPLERAPLRSA